MSDDTVHVLPDGSAFMTASFPLPKTHWLYERDPEGFIGDPPETGGLREATKWAVRATTDCGNILDFDPDAMVQNVEYAMRRQQPESARARIHRRLMQD